MSLTDRKPMADRVFSGNLWYAASRLAQLGRDDSKLALLNRIVRDDNSWRFQKQRLRITLENRDFDAAERILSEIDAGVEVSPADVTWLEARRRQTAGRPIIQDKLIAEIAARQPCAFTPVENRIVYVLHNSLPYSSGGYATRAHGLLQGMRDVGFDVVCITRPGFPNDTVAIEPEDVAPVDVVDGIEYHRLTTPSRKTHAGHRYIMTAAEALEERLRELRPALVMAASNHLTSLPPQIAAARLGIPFIYEVRGFWEVTRASREPEFLNGEAYATLAKLEAISADAADHVFTLTGAMREELMERGVDGDKVTLLPNSCNPEKFPPLERDQDLARSLGIPDGVPVIGYIGSFVQYEGLDDLARAAVLLKQRGVVFRLMLVGNENVSGSEKGPISQAIEEAADKGDLRDWLIMPGRVPHETVPGYYSLIDVAPFPRKPQMVTEMVSPMKPLEAMAMRKAVVASSVRALVEMIRHDVTGLIFEKGNVEDLADKLQRLLQDAELRARLGEKGREWVETERRWRRTAEKAEVEIRRLLDSKTQSEPVPAQTDSGMGSDAAYERALV